MPTALSPRRRRYHLTAAFLALSLWLGGCAGVYRVDSQVQSYARWEQGTDGAVPTGQQHYRFERLPSQREGNAVLAQDQLESLTRTALAKSGWQMAAPGSTATWSVQVSADMRTLPRAPWDEPWGGVGIGWGLYGGNGFFGTHWMLRSDMPYHERKVSLVIRRVTSGQVVYETHADHDGRWNSTPELWGAMLEAALKDFPDPPAGARQINIDLPR
ncbi:MAG: hypothetical protein KDF54_04385 [Hydrogenophaga sp.]|nr:hypothetical protein [Hydrogenophaga sp.]